MHQKRSGSILVFTLIVMTILLMSAISIASVAVIERRTSSDTGKSNKAFAVADSGVEISLAEIKNNPTANLSALGSCSGGVVTINNLVGGKAEITFFKDDLGTKVNCNEGVSTAIKIKSIGVYDKTVRAIEAAVAATPDEGIACCDVPVGPNQKTKCSLKATVDGVQKNVCSDGNGCIITVSRFNGGIPDDFGNASSGYFFQTSAGNWRMSGGSSGVNGQIDGNDKIDGFGWSGNGDLYDDYSGIENNADEVVMTNGRSDRTYTLCFRD